MMRLNLLALMVVGLAGFAPAPAGAEVLNCGGQQPLGLLTCSVTGPAMIDGDSFVGDGGSSAQFQWVGSLTVPTPGVLTLDYTYTGIFNTLFAKIGMRLTVNQPTCEDPHQSSRDFVDPATSDGVARQVRVEVSCAGRVDYIVTSRAATYSLGGSFIGKLAPPVLSFSGAGG